MPLGSAANPAGLLQSQLRPCCEPLSFPKVETAEGLGILCRPGIQQMASPREGVAGGSGNGREHSVCMGARMQLRAPAGDCPCRANLDQCPVGRTINRAASMVVGKLRIFA